MPDHVHLFVRAWPTTAATEIVKQVKATASRDLRVEYPHVLKIPSLRPRSCLTSTAGNVSWATIRRCI